MIRRYSTLLAIVISALALLLAMACGGDTETEGTPTIAPASAGTTSTTSGTAETTTSGSETASPVSTTSSASTAPPSGDAEAVKINVVTTSNILADWARAVGGERVEVFSIVPANADPHTFQPGAQDITRVADADLVLSIGLTLEGGWLDELIENAARNPDVIVALGETVDPIDSLEIFDEHTVGYENEATDEDEGHGEEDEDEDEGHGDEDEHGEIDPHFWLDPLRVKQAVSSISALLSTSDPEARSFYRANSVAYSEELDSLHTWIAEQVGSLPEDRRVLVTSHDSFQYFAVRYGFKLAGAIFPVSTEAEPTAQDLAELIEVIEHEGVPAVFTENSHSQRLAERVAEETGAELIGGLYTGSLGEPGGEAAAYLDLMRHNTKIIVEALK